MEARNPVRRPGFFQFRRSLARKTVIQMLLLALIPVAIVSTVTALRLNTLLRDQLNTRIINVTTSFSDQLQTLSQERRETLQTIKIHTNFTRGMDLLLSNTATSSDKANATVYINNAVERLNSGDEPAFDNIAIYDSSGNLIYSSTPLWLSVTATLQQDVQNLLGTNDSRLSFHLPPFYPKQMVLLTASTYIKNDLTQLATIVGYSKSDLPNTLISTAQLYFPTANAYFFTGDKDLVGLGISGNLVAPDRLDDSQLQIIDTVTSQSGTGKIVPVSWLDKQNVFAFSQPIGNLGTSFMVIVPQTYVTSQLEGIGPVNIALVGIAMLIIGIIIYFGTRQTVRPLVDLANVAQSFADGDWSQRATITRVDEIGQLASAFNQMVNQLSTLYRSLEAKVEERTEQLRVASEIAQSASQYTNTSEMAENAVQLLTERFEYPFAAIYLTDETGNYLLLRAVSSKNPVGQELKGSRIPINSPTLVGWVASHNQSQVALDISSTEALEQGNLIVPETRSEVAVPITVSGQVIGVLDIQMDRPNAFDPETVATLQSLSNQLATGIRNILLVMSAQINYEETSLLYRASRQISTATSENQVIDILSETLTHTNHVCMVLDVSEDHMVLESIFDPRGGKGDAALKGITLPIRQGTDNAAMSGTTMVDDLTNPSIFENLLSFLSRRECQHAAIIPVFEKGVVSKIIALGTRESKPYNQGIIQPYNSIAEIVGSTLERIHLLTNLQEHVTELEILTNLSKAISSETDLHQLLDRLHSQIQSVMGSDLGFFVALYNSRTNLVEFPYTYENGEVLDLGPLALGEGLTSYIIRNKKPLMIVRNTRQVAAQLGSVIHGTPAKSWLGVPLMIGGEAVGALVVQDGEREERFTENDLKLLTVLGPQIATSIRNAQLLTEMAHTLRSYDQERYMLNILLEHIPQEVYFKDKDGNFIRISDSYATKFGQKPKEIVGKTEVFLVGEEAARPNIEEDLAVMEENLPRIGVQKEYHIPDGDLTWTVETKIPLRDPRGDAAGILAIIEDITEFRKAEQIATRRTDQMRTVSEIARDATSTLDLDDLLTKAVNYVRDRFGFYHASVFLLDPSGEYAILRQSTGEAGAKMMQAGHRLIVGSLSIVGQATGKNQPVVSNDVLNDPSYYPNPLLPGTRAELAIPLRSGNMVLGALDVQAPTKHAFQPEDINILQILADQLAGAVINSNLYGKAQESLTKHRLLHQITAAATASQSLDEALTAVVSGLRTALTGDRVAVYFTSGQTLLLRASAGYESTTPDQETIPFGEGWVGKVAHTRAPILENLEQDRHSRSDEEGIHSRIAVPIQYTDEFYGVLCLESPRFSAYDENDRELIATLGNNLGVVIENVQLVNRIRLQVERQRRLFEITNRIRRSTDLETILETSVKEIGQALHATRARIQISPAKPETPSEDAIPASPGENGKEVVE